MRTINRTPAIALFTILCTLVSISSPDAQSGSFPSGKSVGEFLTPDGRFDLDAARRARFQGSLVMKGFESRFDHEGQPVFRAAANAGSPDDIYWDNGLSSSIPGVDEYVYALTVYDGKLIVGGCFTIAGGVSANNIAAWDGSSWFSLGSGMEGGSESPFVSTLTIYKGKLVAGGGFTTAGGVTANGIAVWDGVSWSPLGEGMNRSDGLPSSVLTLTAYDGKLITGGYFTTAGGVTANYIASWDGLAWSPLGEGMNGNILNTRINTLTVYDNNLIAGGVFATAGTDSVRNIAVWNGSAWSPLGEGMNGEIDALTVYDGNLIAGGQFTVAGGESANGIASWDGSFWSPLGSEMGNPVYSLMVSDGKLIAGGWFSPADGASTGRIAVWDGSMWSPLGSGIRYGGVMALTEFDGILIAGGSFTTAGGESVCNIASWDSSEWSSLGEGASFFNGDVNDLTVYDGKLIAGGNFTIAGGDSINFIAVWDGSKWSSLGSGINNYVLALTVFDGDLIVGGKFTVAGGIDAKGVASWNGSTWSSLGRTVTPYALMEYNGTLIAGSSGWNGSEWSLLGDGTDGDICALTVYDGKLIAGGGFITAGGVSAKYIAAWDGSAWSPLGDGMDGSVYALTVYDGKLVAGGVATPSIWDGSAWSFLGDGMNGTVHALTAYDGKLIAGGDFTTTDSGSDNMAVWDGLTWSPLGSGITGGGYFGVDRVNALTVYDDALVVGGCFTTAGGKAAPNIARWTKKGPDSVSEQSSLPAEVTLLQNFPNPFNPSTTIHFSIPTDSRVVLKILTVTGQQVATLMNEIMPAGLHSIVWNAAGMPSGIYFCSVKAGAFAETRKMVLLK